MDTPQEVLVWVIMPALRREFVLAFQEKGIRQKEVAQIMKLTPSAVNQYVKGKRGNRVAFGNSLKKAVRKAAASSTDNMRYREQFQAIIDKIKEERIICNVCHEHTDSGHDCQICYR